MPYDDLLAPVAGFLYRRTTMATLPPLAKKSRTAYPRGIAAFSPPKVRSKSPKLVNVTAWSTGPRTALPRKAVIDVATPVIVRTPLGSSST